MRVKKDIIIQIEPTTRCNHNCSYCPRYAIPDSRTFGDITPKMSDLLVKRFKETPREYNTLVSVSGFGEPTLYPDLIDWICRIKTASRAFIRLNTNASLLDQVGSKIISSGCVDQLTLSLNLPSEELHKKHTGSEDYILCKRNIINFLHEKQARKPASDLRFIRIPDVTLRNNLKLYWSQHLNKNDQISVSSLANWGGLVGKKHTWSGSCRYLQHNPGKHLSIDKDGYASICCFSVAFEHTHPLVVGNIRDHTIDELLTLAKLKAPELLNSSVCRGCNARFKGALK